MCCPPYIISIHTTATGNHTLHSCAHNTTLPLLLAGTAVRAVAAALCEQHTAVTRDKRTASCGSSSSSSSSSVLLLAVSA
eukprot:3437-Heterococcus_DN1.PRE.3